jgi:hypothetical protein
MKSYLIAVIAILAVSGISYAQHGSSPSRHKNFGIKAGLNSYTVHNDESTAGFKSKAGFHAGLLMHIHLSQSLAFQPELVFSTQGTKNDNANSKLNLNYLNVPLLFQYMFDNGFRLQAGPQIGFLLNAKSEVNNSSTDVKSDFKNIDLAASLGASYVHPPTGFGVDVRYNFGLSKINETGSANLSNRGLQFGVFYLFNY